MSTLPPKSNRASSRFAQTDYDLVLTEYQALRGIELHGPEFSPIQQDIKTMFMSGRTPGNIIDCMRFFTAGSEDWMRHWTMKTIKLKLPDFLAGRFIPKESFKSY